jgi:Cys-rich protein (TIGR01571 family)
MPVFIVCNIRICFDDKRTTVKRSCRSLSMATQAEPVFDLGEKTHLHEAAPAADLARVQGVRAQPVPWSTGLFDCCQDAPSVVEALFCRHCQLSRQYNIVNNGNNDVKMGVMALTLLSDIAGAFTIGVAVGTIALGFIVRQRIRQRYHIVGDDLTDLLFTACCSPCATTQNYREMSARSEWSSGNCVSQPFVPPAAVMGVAQQ